MQIFYANIFIIIMATVVSLAKSECQNRQTANFQIECSAAGEYNVEITCRNNGWTKFPDISLALNSAAEIVFTDCSFPATTNVQTIFNSMRIKVTSQITFDELQSTPKRENFKGVSVLRLSFLDSNFTELPFDLLHDVKNLEFFQISHTQLEYIREGFFSDWAENVTEVYIINSKLQKLAKNTFARLANVNVIDLSTNRISEIEPDAFGSLAHLNSLNLKWNRLRTLSSGIFHQMTNLTKIDLGTNSFDDLPQDLLRNTKKLKEFHMSGNSGRLRTLPRGFFKNLTHLESVYLKYAQLESLPADLFSNCSQLNQIILGYNRLTTLPSGLFDDTRNLRILKISDNLLESLPAGIFKGLDRLEELYIDENRLTSLMPDVLMGLQSVDKFVAADNYLSQIDHEFMMHLKSATLIDLTNNELTFDNQEEMTLLKNQTASLPISNPSGSFIRTSENKTVQQFHLNPSVKLKNIKLRYNNIIELNARLMNILKYSEYLDLRNNKISKIILSNFHLEILAHNKTVSRGEKVTKYTEIDLQNNPLRCDCYLTDFLRYLKSAKNELHKTFVGDKLTCASPPEFKNRRVRDIPLEELNCLLNNTTLDDACSKTCICREYPEKRLLYVDCSYRHLTQLPPMIKNVHNWSIDLNMTGNLLQRTPSLSDSYFKNITHLDLSNNKITKVTIDLFSPALQNLRLHGNSISRLDTSIIDELHNSNVRSITLHENKWICDCDTRKLIYLVHRKFNKYRFGEVRCHESNERLYDIAVSEKCKTEIVIMVVSCLLIAFLSIVVGSFAALYVKYRREIKVWWHAKQCCLRVVVENELDKDKKYDAFISFSHEDKDFVEKEIVAKLEGGSRPYKLCLRYRDWSAEESIPEQISRFVEESRRTIVILTPNFLESEWGLFELRAVHTQALKEGKARLIVILHKDVGDIDDLEREIKDYLKLNTYMKWGDPWFWQKLRYALPTRQAKEPTRYESPNPVVAENNSVEFSMNSSIETSVTGEPGNVSMTRDNTPISELA